MRAQNSIVGVLLLCLSANASMAQCFPDSSASWCFLSAANSEAVHTHMVMGPEPDTVILGQTYQRIEEFNDHLDFDIWQFVKRYYVRSDTTGKGYVMLLDSMQEYLVADVSALTGDTVQDVLTATSWGFDQTYWLKPVIVDSVIVFENNGVSVTRQFVHAIQWEPSYPTSYEIFWQAGMGNSYGPVLIQAVVDNFEALQCLRVQDTYVYSALFGYPGLPGIPCDCPLVGPSGVEDLHTAERVMASPNPSTGIFQFTGTTPTAIHIFDTQGRTLFTTTRTEVDLSAYSVGCYRAVVVSESGKSSLPLVVLR